jgi:hypothetical protein
MKMHQLVAYAAVGATVALLTGCAPANPKEIATSPAAAPANTAPAVETPAEDPTTPEPVSASPLAKSDLALTMKVTRKACFGSAGCNISYKVKVAWHNPEHELDGDYDVTYQVVGGEDGPKLDTLTVYADGQYDQPWQDSVSTRSSSSKLSIKVVSVEQA